MPQSGLPVRVSGPRPGRARAHFEIDALADQPTGYGQKGVRVYDFGWVAAARGWGNAAMSEMRLQMHAIDAERLEPRLGTAQSKGCIRVPTSLNELIDRYGVLDADYQEKIANSSRFWVLRDDRTPTPWSGRYLIVVDSMAEERPDWSLAPLAPAAAVVLSPSRRP